MNFAIRSRDFELFSIRLDFQLALEVCEAMSQFSARVGKCRGPTVMHHQLSWTEHT